MSPRALLLSLLAALAERRAAVAAVCGAILILAAVSLSQMPLQLLPEIHYPRIRIIGDIPGQTSRVIEESINEPIEAALFGVPGIVQMESRSGDSRSYIDLFFAPGYDLDRALRDVTQAVQRAQGQIPAGFPEPRIFAVSTMEEPSLQLAFGSATLSPPEIRQRLRSSLLPRLRTLSGVEAVHMSREEIPELVVDVDPFLLSTSGVRLDAIEAMLLQATGAPPSSPMRTPEFEGMVVLQTNGWDARWIEARPLPVEGTSYAVPLGSFARAHRAPSEETVRTRLNEQSAVLVTLHRSPRAHALRLARGAQVVLDDLEGTPAFADLEVTVLYDDSVVTRSAVRSVVTAAIGGALLAMLLLFFALRNRRYTPLVAMVVAVSLSAAITVLHGMGQSLNLLTLAGLLLSVGLGLDYAIIYFDRLDRLGATVPRPHLQAMADMAGPLLGALLTTLAAILPFLLVQGMVALLFRPLIWTVVVAGIFSFLFAVLLLPVFTRREDGAGGATGVVVPEAPAWWWRLQRPLVVWGAAAAVAGVLFFGGRALPFEVLPVVDDGFVEARLVHPVGIPMTEMDRLTRAVEARLAELPGTAAVFATVGGYFRDGLPAFRPGEAEFMIRVDTRGAGISSREWTDRARAAIAELGIPGLRVTLTPPRIRGVQTRLADADLVVVLTREDGDLLALSEVAARVAEVVREVPGLVDVQRMRGGVSPRWMAEPRYEVLAANGVTADALSQVLTYAMEGRVVRQRMENGEPLALRVRFDRRFAGLPGQLEGARLVSLSGGYVQLGDMVDLRLVEEPTHIERREGQRVVRVSGQLDPAGPGPGAVGESVSRALAAAQLPSDVGWWLEGELDALQETRRTFGVSILLALVLVLTLLIVQYGSIPFALAGLVTIPLSGAGAVVLLALLGRPLDGMVLAGLLIAVGVVANNVILVLSQARTESAAGGGGAPLAQALHTAARDRLRPITLTVMSTVLGMSPLLLGGAEVFGLLQPLAIALTGALLMSIPLACLLLPGLVTSLAGRAGD